MSASSISSLSNPTADNFRVNWSWSGHASGRRIVEIRRRKVADLTDADYRHMRKVVGYVERHTAQRPRGDVRDTRWRSSLMNWGHDPLRRA